MVINNNIHIMKRLFTLITVGMALLFAACEQQNDGETLKHINITSNSPLEVVAEGGNVAITYNIVRPIDGAKVKTTIMSGNEMVSAITSPAAGVILVGVVANDTGSVREAIVVVNYGSESAEVVIRQLADNGNSGGGNVTEDVVFAAQSLDGYYYGEKYGEGSDRYAFFLSDKGLNNGGQAFTNGTYYYVDCFSPANKSLTLPLGT